MLKMIIGLTKFARPNLLLNTLEYLGIILFEPFVLLSRCSPEPMFGISLHQVELSLSVIASLGHSPVLTKIERLFAGSQTMAITYTHQSRSLLPERAATYHAVSI